VFGAGTADLTVQSAIDTSALTVDGSAPPAGVAFAVGHHYPMRPILSD